MSLPLAKRQGSSLSPGMLFGSYEIMERLGVGGMGEVYRAKDTRLGRQVAIKTILLDLQSQPDALMRFEQEARAACTLNHPNIVTIYELGQLNSTHYIAMEMICGETLRDLFTSGPIPFRKAITIATQIADALAQAHEIGLVHRDLKPENLMVTHDGTAKILDFGLAKLHQTDQLYGPNATTLAGRLTEPGTVMGTVAYMSPEQTNGAAVGFQSDQFSFGAVLYEMVSGRPPFQGKSKAEIMVGILREEPERLSSVKLRAPAPFYWVVERCLAKDPNQRYASTRDLARDLAKIRDLRVDARSRETVPRPSNLPVQRTAFIGREHEASALRTLISQEDVRLVTLTGPGGIGKTRLGLHVLGEIAGDVAGGVCFVSLSTVGKTESMTAPIAQAIGLRDTPGLLPRESLREYVRGLTQPMLLLLDNFEHLVSAASDVAELLTLSTKLKVVVTSQAPLHVYGEHEFPVPPLAVPDPKATLSLEALPRFPAIALFVERARAVKHDFTVTKENAAAIAAICCRLDGLPLAIELAASRAKLLPPAAILLRLESSLNLLTGGARDLPVRQQTLRGTVDWSYSLLNAAEQSLFRRLSVFVGGCTLEAVEAVCDTKGDLGLDVLDGMASMVDKSLVQQLEQAGAETRFRMLSTIREYALERLSESGEECATRRAHAAYYLVLAEECGPDLVAHPDWLERFDLEHHNFREALEFLISTADADWGMRLGAALFHFWETRELPGEGRSFLSRLLNLTRSTARPRLRARLLFYTAIFASAQADFAAGQKLQEESLETCRQLQDYRGVAVALNALGVFARDRGDLATACALFEQCVATWRDVGNLVDTARAFSNLANVVRLQGDYPRASALYGECLAIFRDAGDGAGVAWTLNYQGDLVRETGDFAAARGYYQQSLSAFQQLGDGWGIASALGDLGRLSAAEGNYADAQQLYSESMKIFRELGHKRGIARVLECLAVSAAAQSRPEQSLRVAGAAAALRHRLSAPLIPAEQSRLEAKLESARHKLTNSASLEAWSAGWEMSMEEAIQDAFSADSTTS